MIVIAPSVGTPSRSQIRRPSLAGSDQWGTQSPRRSSYRLSHGCWSLSGLGSLHAARPCGATNIEARTTTARISRARVSRVRSAARALAGGVGIGPSLLFLCA